MSNTISEALVKFGALNISVARDRAVNAGRMQYNYATLDQILDVVRPALASCGLAVVQGYQLVDGTPYGYTRVYHGESGEYVESLFPINFNQSPQDFGRQNTYGRRYSLSSLLSLATEEDDDSNGHSSYQGRDAQITPTRSPAAPSVPTLSTARTSVVQPATLRRT